MQVNNKNIINSNSNSNETITATSCFYSLHEVLAAFPELPLATFRHKLEEAMSDVVRQSSSSSCCRSTTSVTTTTTTTSTATSSSNSSSSSNNNNSNMMHMDGSFLVAALRSIDWTAICGSYDEQIRVVVVPNGGGGELQHQQQQQQQLFAWDHHPENKNRQQDVVNCHITSFSTTTTTPTTTSTTLLEQLLQVLNNPIIFPRACHIWLVQVLLEQIVWGCHTTTTATTTTNSISSNNKNKHQWPASQQLLLQYVTQWLLLLRLVEEEPSYLHHHHHYYHHHHVSSQTLFVVQDIFSLVVVNTTTKPKQQQQRIHTATTLNITLSVWKHWMRWSSLSSTSSSSLLLLLLPLLWDLLYVIDDTENYYRRLHSQQQDKSREEDTSWFTVLRRPAVQRQPAVASLALLHGENNNDDDDDDDDLDNDNDDDTRYNNNNNINNKQSYPKRHAVVSQGVSEQQEYGQRRHHRHAASQLLALRKVRIKCLRTLQSFVIKHVLLNNNNNNNNKNGMALTTKSYCCAPNVDLYLYTLQQQQQPKQRQSIFVRLAVLFLVESSSSLSSLSSSLTLQQQQQQQPQVQCFDYQQLLQAIWSRKTKASTVNVAGFWLSLYIELLVECAVFDQREQLWNGVKPFLLDWLTQQTWLMPDRDNENRGLDTSTTSGVVCQLHLQALAFLMAYRGNMLIKQQPELQDILAQLSNQYDQPDDWLFASSLSRDEYIKLQSTLQEMGVFGFCHDSNKDCSIQDQPSKNVNQAKNGNNYGWSFDPSAKQTIRACGSYYLSSLFPSNHTRIFSPLSPVNASPHDEDSNDDGLVRQQPKQMPVPMLEYINDDILRHIFSFLGYRRIVTARLVCQHWKQLADHDDGIWKPLYCRRFGYSLDDPALFSEASDEKLPWKQLFIDRWIAERAIRFRRDKNGWKIRLCNRIGCLTVLSTPGRLQKHTASHTKHLPAGNKGKKRSKQSNVCSSGRPTKKTTRSRSRQS